MPPDQLGQLLGRLGGSGAPRTFEFFVSGASDIDHLRDLADATLRRFEQVLRTELELPIHFASWDYREATPTTVARGTLAATSLATVDRCSAVIPIFLGRLGRISSQEIIRAFERRQRGEDIEIFAFVHPERLTDQHRNFFREIRDTFGRELSSSPYHNQLQFQARFDAWLFKFLFERLTTSNPALLGGAAA